MGQYYKVVNLDKKELLHPHKFGDGLKLLEFGASGSGTMLGLAVLLANSNGRGGGDLNTDSHIPGRWAGDRIVVHGDYAENGDPGYDKEVWDDDAYEDISELVIDALWSDAYIRQDLINKGVNNGDN